MSIERPSIFVYDDYRAFLKDYVEYLRTQTSRLSYRSLAFKCGFASPNFLKMVVDGKRGLRANRIPRIASELGLSVSERRFFEALVQFTQSDDPDTKNYYYSLMARHREYKDVRKLERGQFDYYSSWINVAIREMASHPRFREDAKWLADHFCFSATPREVREAIKLLLSLGLLRRNDRGELERSTEVVSAGSQVKSLALRNFHRQMLRLASQSLEKVPYHRRDITSVTVPISAKKVATAKRKIDAFRKKLLAELKETDGDATDIYQVNFQLFPLTQMGGDREEP